MSIERQLEREEQLIEADYESGAISLEEFNKLMRDLQREYRAAAEESAEQAYLNELERW